MWRSYLFTFPFRTTRIYKVGILNDKAVKIYGKNIQIDERKISLKNRGFFMLKRVNQKFKMHKNANRTRDL